MLKRTLPFLVAAIALASTAAPASALQGGSQRYPGWRVAAHAFPTHLTPGVGAGGSDFIQIQIADVGAASSGCTQTIIDEETVREEKEEAEGVAPESVKHELCHRAYRANGSEFPESPVVAPVTVTDTLPKGITYTGIAPGRLGYGPQLPEPWECSGTTVITCTNTEVLGGSEQPAGHEQQFKDFIDLEVSVEAGIAGSLPNTVTASSGGAIFTAKATSPIEVNEEPTSFGFNSFEATLTNPNGTTDTQAGSHPYEAIFSYNLNAVHEPGDGGDESIPAGSETEKITVGLPRGLIGDPGAVQQCPRRRFDSSECPAATQIGTDIAYAANFTPIKLPIYNLVPPPGKPAQFGFVLVGIKTFLDASVRSGGDYGITENVNNLAQRDIVANKTIIWGVPSDPSHNEERCAAVEDESGQLGEKCGLSSDGSGTPFLTLPTSCEEAPPQFSIAGGGWGGSPFQASKTAVLEDGAGHPVTLTGCNHLSITPAISAAPDTSAADTPAGLTVDVKVPQEGLLDNEGLSTADLQNTTVALPAGLVINPGQAAGLQSCPAGRPSSAPGNERFGNALTTGEEKARGEEDAEAPLCPGASQVGTDEIETPLLPHSLKGEVYVLPSNPPNLELLVAASGEGVNLKLVGKVSLCEQAGEVLDGKTCSAPGQLITRFAETPQLPFTNFKLTFSGGAQAALDTPAMCGTYGSNADFSPWSSPFSPDTLTSSTFLIDAPAAGASSCTGPLPFSSTLTAGATTDQAGGYTDFSLLLQRGDDQQRTSSLSFKTPPGLLGMISKVPLCDEADANAGTCSAASQIGHTVVAAGPGPYPLVVPQPGQPPAPIYLTGGYKGAPYGLSIVVPLHVGPFVLETQVVRARIEVDPHTAQLTVTTDALPQIIDGIPTDLRSIDAVIDREGFMFNPTNCTPQSFSGTATSIQGAQAPISSHFQVGSCQSLKFAPDFKVSTQAKTSKAGGASLTAKILYPTTPPGNNQASSQANIKSVKVDLPKQLPSRLTTLQKACLAKVFEANPAACPKESIVGHATAITPVLPVSLTGPAYFVSHGGEAFPSLIIVLQGYGVTVDLVGTTFISHAGITSSTFKQVPDVPISSFELTLPEGKYSALAANLPTKAKGSFCGQTLAMPTAFVAQNGAEIHDSTAISVSGCAKAKKLKKKAKSKHKAKKKR